MKDRTIAQFLGRDWVMDRPWLCLLENGKPLRVFTRQEVMELLSKEYDRMKEGQ